MDLTLLIFMSALLVVVVVVVVVFLIQYCAGDEIKKNEMGGACGTYGGRARCAQGFGGET